jgi:hypothetical protein
MHWIFKMKRDASFRQAHLFIVEVADAERNC